MIAGNVIKFLENWAPPGAAWEKDNVGLQVGSPKRRISNIFLCLELTEKALKEALETNSNFIFTHHPFIYNPIKKINTHSDSKGKLIESLIKKNITLYSAHTNLDFTEEGVSFELAKTLKLSDTKFLVNEKANQFKLVTFIPQENLLSVSNELFNAGAGKIGEYEKCGFSINGTGSFQGSVNASPAIGEKQRFETVDEVRFEVLVNSWYLNEVIAVLKKTHPYEEPAFDVYPIENENVNYGYGVIGELSKAMSHNDLHQCRVSYSQLPETSGI